MSSCEENRVLVTFFASVSNRTRCFCRLRHHFRAIQTPFQSNTQPFYFRFLKLIEILHTWSFVLVTSSLCHSCKIIPIPKSFFFHPAICLSCNQTTLTKVKRRLPNRDHTWEQTIAKRSPPCLIWRKHCMIVWIMCGTIVLITLLIQLHSKTINHLL